MLLLVFGAQLSPVQAQSTPTLSIENTSVIEGHDGTTLLTFTFELSFSGFFPVQVTYATEDGTAIHGEDYIGTGDSFGIMPGQRVSRSMHVIGDTDYEDDEYVLLHVSVDGDALIENPTVILTIENDDPRPLETYVTVDDPQMKEGIGGSEKANVLVFTLTRYGELDRTTNVSVTTEGGTATPGVDYHPWKDLWYQFAPGATTLKVEVGLVGDKEVEPDETVFLNLATEDAYTTLEKTQGIGTILNDDTGILPSVTISDAQVVEGNSGKTVMNFTLTLTPAAEEYREVRTRLVEGTASRLYDYDDSNYDDAVTFYAGESVKTVSVEILGDNEFEADETFTVELYNPWNLTIADDKAIGTILNDDPALKVTHFSLIDAATDTVLAEDFEGGEIDLAMLRGATKLTIQAHTTPASVGSLVFTLNDNPNFRIDNAAPYTLAKDKNGNLKRWKYQLGTSYTLTATPYSEANGSGEAGSAKTITFKITKLADYLSIDSFSLVDATTDTVLIEYFEGGTVDLATLGGATKLTIVANTYIPTIRSVRFALNNKANFRTDKAAPYTLGKDKNGNLKRWKYKLDTAYTLTATPFLKKNGTGDAGSPLTITFTIINSAVSGGELMVTSPTQQTSGGRWFTLPAAP